jgi:hypothetical protein
LVGAVAVVAIDERIKARLLLQHIRGGGFRGLGLQREMHAFMAAILLGMAGADPFDPDAQS